MAIGGLSVDLQEAVVNNRNDHKFLKIFQESSRKLTSILSLKEDLLVIFQGV